MDSELKVYTIGSIIESPPKEDEYIILDPADGSKIWRQVFCDRHGIRHATPHRVGGPARIEANGTETWLHRGFLHRKDGPAITDGFSGDHEWWIMGKEAHTYDDFQRLSGCSDEDILLFIIKYGKMCDD